MYYVEEITSPFQEDETHEFKGHPSYSSRRVPTERGGNIPGTE